MGQAEFRGLLGRQPFSTGVALDGVGQGAGHRQVHPEHRVLEVGAGADPPEPGVLGAAPVQALRPSPAPAAAVRPRISEISVHHAVLAEVRRTSSAALLPLLLFDMLAPTRDDAVCA